MVQQCPNCLVLAGKLHMRCICCGLYFCEDCVDPHKHYCPSYQEETANTVCVTYNTGYSTVQYEKFASLDDLEGPIKEISVEEKQKNNKEHILKANLIFQERFRLGIRKSPDLCPSCKNIMNRPDEKCILCGIKFCTYCVKPEKHKCVIYQYEEKNSLSIKSYKTVIKSPVTNIPELIKEPLITPEMVTKPVEVAKTINEPKIQINLVSDSKEREIKEENNVKKKISLWQRFRSLFDIEI